MNKNILVAALTFLGYTAEICAHKKTQITVTSQIKPYPLHVSIKGSYTPDYFVLRINGIIITSNSTYAISVNGDFLEIEFAYNFPQCPKALKKMMQAEGMKTIKIPVADLPESIIINFTTAWEIVIYTKNHKKIMVLPTKQLPLHEFTALTTHKGK